MGHKASGYFLQNKRVGIEMKDDLAHFAKKAKKGGVVKLSDSWRTGSIASLSSSRPVH